MFFFPLQQKLLVSILINPPSFLSPSDPDLSSHFSRFLPSCRRPFRTLAPYERVDSLIPRPPSLRTTTKLALGRQQPTSRVLGAASVHVVTIVDFIKANDFARRHRRKSDVDRSLARSPWRRVRSARDSAASEKFARAFVLPFPAFVENREIDAPCRSSVKLKTEYSLLLACNACDITSETLAHLLAYSRRLRERAQIHLIRLSEIPPTTGLKFPKRFAARTCCSVKG